MMAHMNSDIFSKNPCLKLYAVVDNIHIEGILSQSFVFGPSSVKTKKRFE